MYARTTKLNHFIAHFVSYKLLKLNRMLSFYSSSVSKYKKKVEIIHHITQHYYHKETKIVSFRYI